jgi:phospholipid N-methyltransferase
MREKIDFLREAVKDIRTTGSITGSSKYLVRNMLEHISFDTVKLAVEFGAGNGCITEEILRKLPKDGKLLAFELNDSFIEQLNKLNDSRLRILHENVAELNQYVAPETADAIISALPLTNMPEEVKRIILTAARTALKPGGIFLQFQYTLSDYALVKEYFPEVDLGFTLLNIPPAFIYAGRK